ncbi:hypothetical protein SmphiM12_123 [Sinorhizobium phage phiM12]|uniref:Uncharacterized protein n=1 Tax=Sinorhizobium phage phiM12 TaxID=1357423 RepID=S5MPJ7_9CAUD|nr:hypothetical protein AB690_gp096 [Sinorhizobium phage phiM12]AGR47755.1 hypothetical protein SmphiM12_123 [Sinorhizobium phage phiM12]
MRRCMRQSVRRLVLVTAPRRLTFPIFAANSSVVGMMVAALTLVVCLVRLKVRTFRATLTLSIRHQRQLLLTLTRTRGLVRRRLMLILTRSVARPTPLVLTLTRSRQKITPTLVVWSNRLPVAPTVPPTLGVLVITVTRSLVRRRLNRIPTRFRVRRRATPIATQLTLRRLRLVLPVRARTPVRETSRFWHVLNIDLTKK